MTDKFYTFSIATTGRCNCSCTYCHFFAGRKKSEVNYDLPKDTFKAYINYISTWKNNVNSNVSYRFTGGEPLVMGDRLFELAEEAFSVIGEGPFVLTNGRNVSDEWIKKGRRSKISHLSISVENPFDPDPFAVPPLETANKISKLSSSELPLIPGVCIIKPNFFEELYKICEWFIKKIGCLPTFVEMNFQAYKQPSSAQLMRLGENIERILEDFSPKVPINILPNISSELGYGGKIPFILIMDLEDKGKLSSYEWKLKIERAHPLLFHYYRKLSCDKNGCPWNEFCKYTAWYWQTDMAGISKESKLRDYCRLKRTINDSFYRVLVNSSHPPTECEIDTSYHFKKNSETFIPIN